MWQNAGMLLLSLLAPLAPLDPALRMDPAIGLRRLL